MKLPLIYIGIDPDLKKSGFALWNKEDKSLKLQLVCFPELVEKLKFYGCLQDRLMVIIEAGWMNKKSNFHGSASQSKSVGERIAKNVGENHAAGKLLVEVCEYYHIPYRLSIPKEKKTKPDFFGKLTGIKTKNQELIDAGMLVYGF